MSVDFPLATASEHFRRAQVTLDLAHEETDPAVITAKALLARADLYAAQLLATIDDEWNDLCGLDGAELVMAAHVQQHEALHR